MIKPNEDEYAPFYHTYIKLIEQDAVAELEEQMYGTYELLKSLPEGKGNYAYAEGKWTLKQLLQHMIDTERVMAYRALRFARNDNTALEGYEQDDYAAEADTEKRSIKDMAEEFLLLRNANLYMIKTFGDEELSRRGMANNFEISVRALVHVMAGHEKHHINVIKEKYLSS